jgi:recombination protein RecT
MSTENGAIVKANVSPTESLLQSKRDSIAAVATSGVDVDRLIKQAAIAAIETPQLGNCDRSSLVLSVARVCELGLDLSKTLGQAYLIPYGNKATLIIGYKGLIELAYRSGRVKMIDAREVRDGDTFSWTGGTSPSVHHEPAPLGKRGDLIGVYCIIDMADGARKVEVMDKNEVEAIRRRSRSGNSGPWQTDYSRMATKTVIRRACQQLPLSPQLKKAMEYDGDRIDTHAEQPKRPSLADKLAGRDAGAEAPETPADQTDIDHGDEPQAETPLVAGKVKPDGPITEDDIPW